MRPIDIVKRLAPGARVAYLAGFKNGDVQLRAAGITTPLRLAHFLAQVMHETGGLTITEESLTYTHAERIRQVWPTRFPTVESAQPFVRNPRGLADKVYNGRMGNRPGSDDGFDYRGRGILQTTGRENYRRMGQKCGVDFEGNPDLVLSAEHCLKPALAEWTEGGLNAAADRNDIMTITKRINGGLNGLADRREWLAKIKPMIASVELAPAAVPSPMPAPSPAPAPAEKIDIAWLQLRLNELKITGTPLEVDGIMGARTVAALKAFQQARGLDPDGIPGPLTIAALQATPAPAKPPLTPTLEPRHGIASAIAVVAAAVAAWGRDHWVFVACALAFGLVLAILVLRRKPT